MKYEILKDLKYSPNGTHVVEYDEGQIVETQDVAFIKIFTEQVPNPPWIKEVKGKVETVKDKKEIPENKMENVTENKAVTGKGKGKGNKKKK